MIYNLKSFFCSRKWTVFLLGLIFIGSTQNVWGQYCTPSTTNDGSNGDYLINFKISGGLAGFTDSADSTTGYLNYYDIHYGKQTAGSNLNFNTGTRGNNVRLSIWVDWNNNGEFEVSEKIFNHYTSGSNPNFSGIISIPPATASGDYRMRVRSAGGTNYYNDQIDPCGNVSWGQARDYKIIVESTAPCTAPPMGGTTVLSPDSGAPGSTVNGSVTGASNGTGLTYHWQYSDDGSTWPDIDGQTGETLNTTAIGTPGIRQYRRKITCSGQTSYSTPATYTTVLNYCIPPDSNCSGDNISAVKLETLNDTGLTCNPRYENRSSVQNAIPNLEQDETYSMSVGVGNGGTEYVGVWIDFNQDGDFDDSGEFFPLGSGNNVTITGNIIIPSTVTPGNTRMRVRSKYGDTFIAGHACSQVDWGTTRDYTVNILSSSCPKPTNLNHTQISSHTANISWTAPSPAPANGYEYAITTSSTPPLSGTSTMATSVNDVAITEGTTNYLHVRSNCGSSYFSGWTTYSFVVPPAGQIGTTESSTKYLPVLTDFHTSYSQQIYLNSELTAAIGAVETQINKIKFYYNQEGPGGHYNFDTWSVYIGHTSKSEFNSDTDWVSPGTLTKVYEGRLTIPAAGNWMEIELDTPFNWNGSENLVIAILENKFMVNPTALFGSFTTSERRSLLHYQDSGPITPSQSLQAYSGIGNVLNTIRLDTSEPCAAKINSVDPVTVCAENEVDLTVHTSGANKVKLYEDPYGGVPIGTYNVDGNIATISLTAPMNTKTYYVSATANSGCESSRRAVKVIVNRSPENVNIVKSNGPGSDGCIDYVKLTATGGNSPEPGVIYEENFDAPEAANDWSFEKSPSSSGFWHVYNTAYAGGNTNELYFEAVNETKNGEWAAIKIDPIDIAGYTNLSLNLKYYIKHNQNRDYSYFIEVSNNGINWIPVWTISEVSSDQSGQLNLNLNAYVGNNLYLRFRSQGNGWGAWRWTIDDIKLTGTGNPQPKFIWSPAEGLYTDSGLTTPYNGEPLSVVYAAPWEDFETFTATGVLSNFSCTKEATENVETTNFSSRFTANTGNWDVSDYWSPKKVPNITKCVRVPAGKTLTVNVNNAEARNVTVEAGGKLIISDGNSLRVDDFIKNQAGFDNFVVKHDGNLIQNNDVTNFGEITVEKNFNFSADRKEYNYLTTPVVSTRALKSTLYTPSEPPPLSLQYYKTSNDYFYETTGLYETGKAYAVQESPGSGATVLTGKMMGIPFNGYFGLNLDTSGNKYNLIGNPYPSDLDIQLLYFNNSSAINPEFYFWDNRNNQIHVQQGSSYSGVQYAIYNAAAGTTDGTGSAATNTSGLPQRIPNRKVKVGTGFMVQAKNAGPLNFNNSFRINDANIGFFGKPTDVNLQDDRYWLTMTSPSEMVTMMAVVYFEGGNDEFAIDDSESMLGSDDLYSLAGNKKLVIQGKSAFRNTDEIPLGYKAFETGTYYISLYDKEGAFAEGQNIYIIDKLLNKSANLSNNPYKFLTRAGEYTDRFVIVYKPKNIFSTSVDIYNKIEFAKIDNQIVITSTIDKITDVEIFDLNNRSVYSKSEINSNEHKINAFDFNHQIVVVTVKTDKGEFVTQKFVNN